MKKTLLGILLLAMTGIVSAQEETAPLPVEKKESTKDTTASSKPENAHAGQGNGDTIVINARSGKLTVMFHPSPSADTLFEDKKNMKKGSGPFSKKNPNKFWSGLDIGYNGYLTPAGNTKMLPAYSHFNYKQGKSIYLGFNLFERNISLYKNRLGLVTGLGLDYNNYRFSGVVYPFDTPDSLGNRSEKEYVTNRMRTLYATVPLLLAVDLSKKGKDGLKLSFGLVGGLRMTSHTKEKVAAGGDVVKTKTRWDMGLNPFRVNTHARLSYGDFGLFASYSLTSMFRSTPLMPEVYPFQIGISLGG
jgi:hypothetical protein